MGRTRQSGPRVVQASVSGSLSRHRGSHHLPNVLLEPTPGLVLERGWLRGAWVPGVTWVRGWPGWLLGEGLPHQFTRHRLHVKGCAGRGR